MKRLGRVWSVAAVVGAAVAGSGSVAAAQGADDHAAAMAIVTQLEHDTAHAAVTAEAVTNAKSALERATRLRAAGDETHARAADGLAVEWAQTGRDLAKAMDAETTAADLRHKAVDAQAQLERTRALVEEGITRVGRLQAELQEAEKTPRPDRVAVETHEGDPPRPKAGSRKHAAPDGKKPSKTGGAP